MGDDAAVCAVAAAAQYERKLRSVTGWASGVVAVGLVVLLFGWVVGVLLERFGRSGTDRDSVVAIAARGCGVAQGLGAATAATAVVLWMALAAF